MRFVLFYETTESFNYFSDEIAAELRRRGYDTFILDLVHTDTPSHSLQEFTAFCGQKVDAVICFDRIGIHNEHYIGLWNLLDTCAVNILMDHPLRFHPTMEHHPDKYIQLCPDENHVNYVRKYFPEVAHVAFLPHAGTVDRKTAIPYTEKKYDILFTGTYYIPQAKLQETEAICPKDSSLYRIYMQTAEYLAAHPSETAEEAVSAVLCAAQMELNDNSCKTIMRGITPIDWMIRMLYREKVIKTLVNAGFQIHVLGRGWEKHPCADSPNLHIINDRIPFAETFDYIRNAKINLNVMPWFKAGTHDRIFNTMLRRSVCLTDTSTWIDSHFTDGENIALYHLEHLDQLPEIADFWLNHPAEADNLIRNAYDIASGHYTWVNCVDSVLDILTQTYPDQ